ncbi:MAG: 6-bladed beta-propeller [candidate division Zixibacteria bacterium]|nr:6-bladed beta-propeller [candidate division Zixibacteria bacterium]
MHRIVQTILALACITVPFVTHSQTTEPYQVVHGWPKLPKGFALGQTTGVDTDSHNHVFIVHRSKIRPIMMFDGKTGELLGSYGDGLFGEGGQHGLEVDDQDNVWVTDTINHQVMKFSHEGELLMTLGKKGMPGWDANHFNQRTDIVIAPNGDFYVSDGYGNRRVAKFDKQGQFQFDWGSEGSGPGQFVLPHSVDRDAEGRIYVVDRTNARIAVFDATSKPLTELKMPDNGRPWGLDIAADGHLWVVDGGDMKPAPPDRGQIIKMDLKGNVVAKFGSFGSYDGQIYWGHDVALAKDGSVYVGDVNLGMRVQKFVPTGK